MKASSDLKKEVFQKNWFFPVVFHFFLFVFSTSFLIFFVGQSTTKNNFLKNLAVSHNFWPAYKMGSKPGKTVLVEKRVF